MNRMTQRRAAIKELVRSGAMPRATAEKIVEAERPAGARMEVMTGTESGRPEMFLYDVIDSWGGWWGISAGEVRQALTDMGDVDEFTLRINSPGGEISEGNAIYSLLAAHSARINVVVDGLAASMASIIAMAGDRVTMNHGGEIMIHCGWNVVVGDAAYLEHEASNLRRADRVAAQFYAARAGGDVQQWLDAMAVETWYFGAEAVEAGLADDIIPPKSKSDDSGAQALAWDKAMLTKIDAADSGGDETPTQGAPDDSTDPAATAAGVEERQRAERVVARAKLSALGVNLG